jgi:uncharacterized RDD family membrane protein YckC
MPAAGQRPAPLEVPLGGSVQTGGSSWAATIPASDDRHDNVAGSVASAVNRAGVSAVLLTPLPDTSAVGRNPTCVGAVLAISGTPHHPGDSQVPQPNPWPQDPAPGIPPATGPPPEAPPREQKLLGLRIAAALVDIALLCGLFIIVGLAVGATPASTLPPGEANVTAGSVTVGTWWVKFGEVTVGGWWLALYLAALLLYYFTLEARTGQTVGKRLLGLRVLRADGGRPSAAAIAVRTLLRLIDWLPFLYLTGFITTLATGARRRRLGDLAAGTDVTRGVSARHRHTALAVTLALLAIFAMSVRVNSGESANAASDQAIRGCQADGVSFGYPPGWHQVSLRARALGSNVPLCRTALFISTSDGIIVEAYALPRAVNAGNFATITSLLKRQVPGIFRSGGGAAQTEPRRITVGGLLALKVRGSGRSADGAHIDSTLVFAYDGKTEYSSTVSTRSSTPRR